MLLRHSLERNLVSTPVNLLLNYNRNADRYRGSVPDRDAGLEEFRTSSSSVPPVAEVTAQGSKDLPIREGLPAHNRMRADAHYVDQLGAPPISTIQMVSLDAI